MTVINKAGTRIADTYDFVLSTEAPDRVGDIVVIEGLDTKAFEANPIALYMHNHSDPIGAWTNLRKSNGALTGTLALAAKGTSKLVDFSRAMLQQGMLKAVSVAFMPRVSVKNADRGYTIKKSELIEVSLVTVPMNPQALMIAKSFDFDDAEIASLLTPANCGPNENLKTIALMRAISARHL